MRRRIVLVVSALLTVAACPLWAQQLPRPVGHVNDFANIIPAGDEQQMEQIIVAVREQTPAEIAVVTVESMSPYATIEDYGIALCQSSAEAVFIVRYGSVFEQSGAQEAIIAIANSCNSQE